MPKGSVTQKRLSVLFTSNRRKRDEVKDHRGVSYLPGLEIAYVTSSHNALARIQSPDHT